MGPYLLFAGSNKTSSKGFQTKQDIFDSIQDAKDSYEHNEKKEEFEWGQIVDLSTQSIIETYQYVKLWREV